MLLIYSYLLCTTNNIIQYSLKCSVLSLLQELANLEELKVTFCFMIGWQPDSQE